MWSILQDKAAETEIDTLLAKYKKYTLLAKYKKYTLLANYKKSSNLPPKYHIW